MSSGLWEILEPGFSGLVRGREKKEEERSVDATVSCRSDRGQSGPDDLASVPQDCCRVLIDSNNNFLVEMHAI